MNVTHPTPQPPQVPLFKECEPAFIAQLVIRLRLAVFLPSEVIFRIGDVGHEMYFITKVRPRAGVRGVGGGLQEPIPVC